MKLKDLMNELNRTWYLSTLQIAKETKLTPIRLAL